MRNRPKFWRFSADPLHKPLDLRFGLNCFQRIQFTLQLFLREQRVNVIMARATKHRDAVFHVGAIELAFVAFVLVTRAWDKVMTSERVHEPAT